MPFKDIKTQAKKMLEEEGIPQDYLLAFLYGVIGLISAFNFYSKKDYVLSGILFLVTVSIVRVKCTKTKNKQVSIISKMDPGTSIEVALESLYNITLNVKEDNDQDHGLRMALYRLSEDRKFLIQHTRYFGLNNQPAGERHTVPIEKGIIGLAYRSRQIQVVRRAPDSTYEDFLQFVIDKFAYTEREACQLSRDRFSWVAIPIIEESGVHSVLFCDSKIHDFFGHKHHVRPRILAAACGGLAKFLARQ